MTEEMPPPGKASSYITCLCMGAGDTLLRCISTIEWHEKSKDVSDVCGTIRTHASCSDLGSIDCLFNLESNIAYVTLVRPSRVTEAYLQPSRIMGLLLFAKGLSKLLGFSMCLESDIKLRYKGLQGWDDKLSLLSESTYPMSKALAREEEDEEGADTPTVEECVNPGKETDRSSVVSPEECQDVHQDPPRTPPRRTLRMYIDTTPSRDEEDPLDYGEEEDEGMPSRKKRTVPQVPFWHDANRTYGQSDRVLQEIYRTASKTSHDLETYVQRRKREHIRCTQWKHVLHFLVLQRILFPEKGGIHHTIQHRSTEDEMNAVQCFRQLALSQAPNTMHTIDVILGTIPSFQNSEVSLNKSQRLGDVLDQLVSWNEQLDPSNRIPLFPFQGWLSLAFKMDIQDTLSKFRVTLRDLTGIRS